MGIRTNVYTAFQLYCEASRIEAFREGGIGLYPDEGFVHVDVRGVKARWGRVNKRGCSIEEAEAYAKRLTFH